jgi:serpin B
MDARFLPDLTLCAALGCGAVCSDPPTAPAQELPMDTLNRFAQDSNAFGLELYRRLRTQPGNLVLSPASVSLALAMAWGGARAQTGEQMRQVLHFEGTPEQIMQASGALARQLQDPGQPIRFRIANRLFGEKTYAFEQAYLDATRAAYDAPLQAVDFRHGAEPARQQINAWVEQQTAQRIRDLIPPGGVDADTRLALVNAIYFLGDWEVPFEQRATQPAPFFTAPGVKKDTPTMHRQDTLRFVQQDGLKALELPYKGRSLSMLLVLPDPIDGIGALEQSLDAGRFERLVQGLQPQPVRVALPKFEINPAASQALSGALQGMGMRLAFDRRQADFSGIADPPDPADRLVLSQVFHKAFVRVDEQGTEAAAATAAIMVGAAAMRPPQRMAEFIADHPFLFFIRDNASGLILFQGRVAEPVNPADR